MGRSQETFHKKEVRNKKEKKRKEKQQRRQERKEKSKSGSSLDDMIAYVDENGMITSTPPDPSKKTEIKSEDIEIDLTQRNFVKEDPIKKGIVSYFNESKGFGFIREKVTRQSVFFHVNNLIDDVKENSAVTFEMGKGPKGPTADQVRLDK